MDRIQRIVLIHGALHGGWCWHGVAARLRAKGFVVQAPDLPGAGDDLQPPAEVCFTDYVRRIVETVEAGSGPVLLLGHSMAGGAVSRAAEEVSERVGKLVYLTAMLPKDGETLGGMVEFGDDSVMRGARPGDVEGVLGFDLSLAPEIFYGGCPAEVVAGALARLSLRQPIQPLAEPIRLTAGRWGAIPKTYILCTQDRAMPPSVQRWLCERAPEVAVRTLESDHSPFLSMPETLAALIENEAAAHA